MKFNSIVLKFTDTSEDTAKMEIILDPPPEDGKLFTEIDFEDQPSIALATRVMGFLSFMKNLGEETEDGGSGTEPQIVH